MVRFGLKVEGLAERAISLSEMIPAELDSEP